MALLAGPSAAMEPPELSILVDSEWALGMRGPHSQKLEVVAQPELHWALGADTRLTAIGRLRADAFDRILPGHPRATEVSSFSRVGSAGDHVDFELRELFIETQWGRTWLTLGKQQIVWGQADGLKVLDVVNPQDFREFILDEFDDSRIPLWTVNAEVPIGAANVQLLWLPDPSYHDLPEPDATFAFTAPRFLPPQLPGHLPSLEQTNRPRRLLADSDAGIRIAAFVGGFDLSVNYLYHRADRPVFEGRRGSGPFGPTVTFTPRYRRTHLLGGTFSNAFGDLTLRGEVGWTSDRRLSVEDPSDTDLVGQTGELAYVLGLDWFGFRDTLLSFQVFQSWLLRDETGWLRDRLESNLTFLVRREFWNERLRLEGIWLHNLNDGDGLLRPKLSFELRDDLTLWAGLDIFYGRSRGVFGEFDGRDRAVLGMKWGW
ncbi:MAG: hypothetical protein GY946_03875 [bacterium]|nr:hypothetical protein [bacterium]